MPEEMRSGADWATYWNVIIHDPDGWRNPHCSLSDMITEKDFWERVAFSTCMIKHKAKKRLCAVLNVDDKLTPQEASAAVRERTQPRTDGVALTAMGEQFKSQRPSKFAPPPILTQGQAEAWSAHFKEQYPQLFGMPPAAQEVSEDAAYAAWDNRPDISDEQPLKDAFVQGYKQCLADWVNKS